MFLDNNGKYFFEETLKNEYTLSIHNEILDNIEDKEFSKNMYQKKYNKIVDGKKYVFSFELNLIKIENESQQMNLLNKAPINIKILTNEKIIETRDVFTFNQLNIIFEFFQIDIPFYSNKILTEQFIKDLFLQKINYKEIIISDYPIESIISDIKNNEKMLTFYSFSKFINLYIKSEFGLNKYIERKFLAQNIFNINPEIEINYFSFKSRKKLWDIFLNNIYENKKEYFMTGPQGNGKTFSLLGFVNSFDNLNSNIKIAYYNLDALNNSQNYLDILIYESRKLFNNIEEIKAALKYIKKTLIIYNDKIPIIEGLINFIDINNNNDGIKYIIIFDQYKYVNNGNIEENEFNHLRNVIKKKNNFFLIVCSSINYKGVKDSLLKNWFFNKDINIPLYELNNYIINYKDYIKEEDEKNNNLKLLGYFPRYYQMKNILNKKIINVLKKKIKDKIKKFYNNNNHLIEDNLRQIKYLVNKKLDLNEFKSFIETKPIKYFLLDNEEKKVNYLYPLVKIAINELFRTLYFEIQINDDLSGSEKGWIFEHSCINKLVSENLFMNYYIDNVFEIKSIFNREKIDYNFNMNENSLFIFKYNNIKRYDCAIFLGNENYLLLIQISTHKTKKLLEQYKDDVINKDILKIKRFLKENNIYPVQYYLFFILDYNNYKQNANYMEQFSNYKFNYYFYNKQENKFYNNFFQGLSHLNINNDETEIEQKRIISFKKHSFFEIIGDENIDNIEYSFDLYYAEVGMNLSEFIDEICHEFIIYDLNELKEKYLLKTYVKTYESAINYDYYSYLKMDKIIIVLDNGTLYIGKSNIISNKYSYNWEAYGSSIFFTKNNEKNLFNKKGYFIFENQIKKK